MPERTCVGCRRRRPQAELVRFVLTPDGHAVASRTAAGRGAWLCASGDGVDEDCFDVARRRRGFERAWRRSVPATALDDVDRPRPGGKPAGHDDDEQGPPDRRRDVRARERGTGVDGVAGREPGHRKG